MRYSWDGWALQVTTDPIIGLLHLYGPGPTLAADLVQGADATAEAGPGLPQAPEEEAEICAVVCASHMVLLQVRRQTGYCLLCAGPTAPIQALQSLPYQVSCPQLYSA